MTRETSRLRQEQLESLTEIGAYLRQIREDYVLSLDEIASRTMIQARLLKAIEEGKLDGLPEPVYIQGFIKLYADALGLDGNQFADAFPTERQVRVAQSSWKDSPAAQLRPLHLYLAYVALIMASVSLLSHIVNRSSPPANSVASPALSSQQLVTSSPNAQNSPAASPSPARSANRPSDPNRPVRIDIKLTAQSWMRVTIDGQTEFEGVLPEGTERTWQARSQLTVRAGNAGGVLLTYNQGAEERMGAPGAVEEKTFSLSQDAASLPTAEIAR
ncbi:MAG: helix-turn-helix domain-containing protein [Elainellaceae cyanobacterium]